MFPYTGYIFNFAILIGAIIGGIRFRRIHPDFYPFVFLMWAGALNEIVSISLAFSDHFNVVNVNIYNFAQSLMVIWLFYRWRLFKGNPKHYQALLLIFSIAWLADLVFISGFSQFNSWFRIFYSFVLTLLSISMLNRLLFNERTSLLRNPVFLICCGFIIFYTLTVLTETLFVYELNLNTVFRAGINNIMISANLLCNLIYALAIIWMPRRQAFSLQY